MNPVDDYTYGAPLSFLSQVRLAQLCQIEMQEELQASTERLAVEVAREMYAPLPACNLPKVPWYRRVWRWLVGCRYRLFPWELRRITEPDEDGHEG